MNDRYNERNEIPGHSAFEIIDSAVGICSDTGHWVYANPAFCGLLGLDRSDVEGSESLADFWPAARAVSYSDWLRSQLARGESTHAGSQPTLARFEIRRPGRPSLWVGLKVVCAGDTASDLFYVTVTPESQGLPAEQAMTRLLRVEQSLSRIALEVSRLQPARATGPRSFPGIDRLSKRERQVLSLVSAGTETRAVAQALFISPHTVRNHLKAIYSKLGVHSQRELVALGYSAPVLST